MHGDIDFTEFRDLVLAAAGTGGGSSLAASVSTYHVCDHGPGSPGAAA